MTTSAPKRVLFVCVENSNRSQMAQAFARIHGGERIEAYSAGSRPSGIVNPRAIEAMRARGFPPLVNAENIYDQHSPRNPHLMDALYYLDYVKCAHEGTRRMRQTMADSNLPHPEFSQKETAFVSVRVILRNNLEQRKVWLDSDATKVVGELIFRMLNANEKRVINFAAEYKCIGVSQVQRLTNLSWPASKKLLNGLAERGILHHRKRANLDRDPGARYYLQGE